MALSTTAPTASVLIMLELARPSISRAAAHAVRMAVQPSAALSAPGHAARSFSSVAMPLPASARRGRAIARPLACARRHISVQRSSAYAQLAPEDLDHLAACLSSPATRLLTTLPPASPEAEVARATPDELNTYNIDWMGKYVGKSQVVVKPKTTEEVSKVLQYCHERNLAVVPQGGNTGLVGGGVPVFDEVVLNLSNMNSIRKFDPVAGTLVCDAGCILESLDNELAGQGYMMPLDLGAKGTCHIGGNVATNAGGLRFLRYGSLHGNVLGLEVVLADGTIVDGLSTLRKDNTGYDLKQLFIGSEGTLGIITGVSIVTPKKPEAVNVAVFGLESFEKVQQTFVKAKRFCSEVLSAFEYVDQSAFDVVQKHTQTKDPFDQRYPFYVLIETQGSNKEHDDEVRDIPGLGSSRLTCMQKLNALLENLMETETVVDGVVAQDPNQATKLWSLRELIPEAAGKEGKTYKYDLSMPIPDFETLSKHLKQHLKDQGVWAGEDGAGIREVVSFGHIGDGNQHINVIADRFDEKYEKAIEPHIYEWVSAHKYVYSLARLGSDY